MRRLMPRVLAKVRNTARRAAVTLTACAATALWCCWWTVYTALGAVCSVAALVVTVFAAAVCWIVSGE